MRYENNEWCLCWPWRIIWQTWNWKCASKNCRFWNKKFENLNSNLGKLQPFWNRQPCITRNSEFKDLALILTNKRRYPSIFKQDSKHIRPFSCDDQCLFDRENHSDLVESAHTWDETGCEFDSWQCPIYTVSVKKGPPICYLRYPRVSVFTDTVYIISHVHRAYDYLSPFRVLWLDTKIVLTFFF